PKINRGTRRNQIGLGVDDTRKPLFLAIIGGDAQQTPVPRPLLAIFESRHESIRENASLHRVSSVPLAATAISIVDKSRTSPMDQSGLDRHRHETNHERQHLAGGRFGTITDQNATLPGDRSRVLLRSGGG